MRYPRLGSSGLQISEVALGTLQVLWTSDRDSSFAVLDRFVERGGTFVDTANAYTRQGAGVGSVETLIGEWMRSRGNRDGVVLATKVRAVMWDGPNGEGLSRAHVVRAVEDSLRRLGTDHVDLYQAHWIDVHTPIEETLHAFDNLVRQGKVRYVGASNFSSPWRLAEALLVARYEGLPSFVSYQPHFSLLYREELERRLLPLVTKYGLAVLPYSPLEGGFLTGKYGRGRPLPETRRADRVAPLRTEENFAVLDEVEAVARDRGWTPAQVALAWVAGAPGITAPIIGPSSVAQLDELLEHLGERLEPEEAARLDACSQWERPVWWLEGQ